MSDNAKKFYVTTPIFYPNAALHMGHAYVNTLSDALARYHRLIGDETYFLSGTDDHATKVAQAAEREGKDPVLFVEEKKEEFLRLYNKLGISFDDFIQTHEQDRHWPGAIEVWNRIAASGDLEKREYEGLYCEGCESFKTDKDLTEDGKCPDHDKEPISIKEENWFFKLSKYTDQIREKIESGELEIVPEKRKNEILALLERGLEDVSFSRPQKSIPWGIPVPDDPEQIMYVWCDALTNYISALGFGRDDQSKYEKFWPASTHVIGKDILRFHAAIWPGMLLSAGLPLPKRILVHAMILSGGRKMSKTIGNVIDPFEVAEKYGVDALRYYLLREVSPFEDGDFTMERFHEVYTANLVNGIGNLASRIMKMAETHLDSALDPSCAEEEGFDHEGSKAIKEALERYDVKEAMDLIWKDIGETDEYIAESQPFSLMKSEDEEERKKGREIIEALVSRLIVINFHLQPFLPETSRLIREAIEANKKPENLFPRLDI